MIGPVSAPRTRALPYPADSAALFKRLLHLPWPMFLDSADGVGYDILVAAPRETFTTHGAVTRVSGGSGGFWSSQDPFQLLSERLKGSPRSGPPPFSGGLLGYFGYDLARRVERLPHRARADLAMPDMAVGLYDWALVVDHQRRRAWLAGDWPKGLPSLLAGEPVLHGNLCKVTPEVEANLDRAAYAKAFQRVRDYIREGDVYQVNLARRFTVRVSGHPWGLYRRLRVTSPAPFGAYLQTPYGSVLSASPERFLEVRDGRVETRPIKGTRPRATDPEADTRLAGELLESPKDRAENLMIVDLLRNDLGRNCAIGSIHVPSLFEVESFSNVHHLVSTVRGRLAPQRHALDLLRGCFPGGSITGAPKVRAMEIIEELEPHRRGVYCGAIGYVGLDGNMDTNIAIRTLVQSGDTLRFWAGGGIVADSREAEEYQEILDKAQGIAHALGVVVA